jgi:hypothetical protein
MDNNTKVLQKVEQLNSIFIYQKTILYFEEAAQFSLFSKSYLHKKSYKELVPNHKRLYFLRIELLDCLKQECRKKKSKVSIKANIYFGGQKNGVKITNKYNNKTQIQKVHNAFYGSPKTMKEVDAETGIMRANICRYCSTLVAQNKLFIVGKRRCKITKSRNVTIYTSNPDLAPNHPPQLSLF